jgi:hypothetical protein
VASGYYSGSIDFGGGDPSYPEGSYGAYILKLTNDGSYQWSRSFAYPAQQQFPWDHAVDSRGNVVLVGYFSGKLDLTGEGPDGGGILPAYQPCAPLTCVETGFVLKLDKNGKLVFGRAMGDPDRSIVEGIATDRAGNIVVAGAYQGGLDIVGEDPADGGIGWDGSIQNGWRQFVAKLDGETGARLWGYPFAEKGSMDTMGVVTDGEDDVFLTATSRGSTFPGLAITSASPSDTESMLLARLDPQGRPVWLRRFAGAQSTQATALAVDRCADEVFLAGTFRSVMTLDRADDAGLFTIDGTKINTPTNPPSGALFLTRLAR